MHTQPHGGLPNGTNHTILWRTGAFVSAYMGQTAVFTLMCDSIRLVYTVYPFFPFYTDIEINDAETR